MAIKYLYIDDSPERGDMFTRIANAELVIIPQKPEDFITVQKSLSEYDGVILDWQLQNSKDKALYTSASLAQELREVSNHNKDVTIVLCSADSGFLTNRNKDKTSHGLFDMVYSKHDFKDGNPKIPQYRKELIVLAQGYKVLNEVSKTVYSILGIAKNEYESLDVRFQSEFNNFFEIQSPSHEIARFLLREVIEYQGILIDEYVLAARLGVDIHNEEQNPEEKEASKKAWEKLKEELKPAEYNGVFSEAWQRWWWFKVENWLSENFSEIQFQFISATKRIEVLKRKFPEVSSLTAAKPLEYCDSEEFWTICYETKKPLDAFDGFRTNIKTHFDWQEEVYVSNQVAVNDDDRSSSTHWKISPLDKSRLENFKKALRNEQKK